MTPEQIELARHALGLNRGHRRSYRNHFVTGPGTKDYELWQELVNAGLARSRHGSALTGGDTVFWLTQDGAQRSLRRGETLDPDDFNLPSQRSPQGSEND